MRKEAKEVFKEANESIKEQSEKLRSIKETLVCVNDFIKKAKKKGQFKQRI